MEAENRASMPPRRSPWTERERVHDRPPAPQARLTPRVAGKRSVSVAGSPRTRSGDPSSRRCLTAERTMPPGTRTLMRASNSHARQIHGMHPRPDPPRRDRLGLRHARAPVGGGQRHEPGPHRTEPVRGVLLGAGRARGGRDRPAVARPHHRPQHGLLEDARDPRRAGGPAHRRQPGRGHPALGGLGGAAGDAQDHGAGRLR